MSRPTLRRDFLAKAAAFSAAAPALSRVLGANDRIQMGVIGAGKRGFSLMNRMRTQTKYPVVFTAACDVLPEHLARACAATGDAAAGYRDHRQLLEQKDVQAVLIASPEHWHRDHVIDAVMAGKDAYLETPLCHTIEEADEIVSAVRGSGRIVQVGIQERSGSHFLAAKSEVIGAGLLGTITQVSSWWRIRWAQAPEEKAPEGLDWERFLGKVRILSPTPNRFWEWGFFWDFSGGIMTDKGQHVCDWTHWFMGADKPLAAVMSGGTYAIRRWEVPDTFTAVWEYPNWAAEFSVSYSSGFSDWHDHGTCFRGTEGSLGISRRGWRHYSEREKLVVKESPGSDMDGAHIDNFLACLVDRSATLNSTVETARSAFCAAYWANLSFRTKRRIAAIEGWSIEPAAGKPG